MKSTFTITSAILFLYLLQLFSVAQGQEKSTKFSIKRLDSLEKDYYRWFKGTYEGHFSLYRECKVYNLWAEDSAFRLKIENTSVYPYVKGKRYKCPEGLRGLYKNAKVSFYDKRPKPLWIKEYSWHNNRADRVDGRILTRYGGIVVLGISDTSDLSPYPFDIEYPIWKYIYNRNGDLIFSHHPKDGFGVCCASDSGKYLVFRQFDDNNPYYLILSVDSRRIDSIYHEDIYSIDDAGYIIRAYTPEINKTVRERIHIDSLRQLYRTK